MATVTVIDEHLVEDVISAYAEWRAQCRRVRESYGRWSGTSGADATLAFAACLSALDREERCAARLDKAIGRLASVNTNPIDLRELRGVA